MDARFKAFIKLFVKHGGWFRPRPSQPGKPCEANVAAGPDKSFWLDPNSTVLIAYSKDDWWISCLINNVCYSNLWVHSDICVGLISYHLNMMILHATGCDTYGLNDYLWKLSIYKYMSNVDSLNKIPIRLNAKPYVWL